MDGINRGDSNYQSPKSVVLKLNTVPNGPNRPLLNLGAFQTKRSRRRRREDGVLVYNAMKARSDMEEFTPFDSDEAIEVLL